MFLLNKKYYIPIINSLIKLNKNDKLKIWVYSRIDTVPNPEILKKIRKAGIRYGLLLGLKVQIKLDLKFQKVNSSK